MSDEAGNEEHIDPQDSPLLSGTSITVINGGSDNTIPTLQSLSLTDSSINIGVGETSIAELHTHDTSGTLHLEAAGEITDGSFDLGHFFDTWGVTLDENCVGEHCRP